MQTTATVFGQALLIARHPVGATKQRSFAVDNEYASIVSFPFQAGYGVVHKHVSRTAIVRVIRDAGKCSPPGTVPTAIHATIVSSLAFC